MRTLMFNRNTLLLLAAAVFAGLGLLAAQQWMDSRTTVGRPQLDTVIAFPTPRVIPPFELVSEQGAITPETLRGRWTVVFIGFVSCPDVCPTTLTDLSRAQNVWQALPEAQRPRLLFVSIDPERDSPSLIAGYARHFHPETLAATQPDLAQLEAFTNSLSLVFRKVPLDQGYTMDHSSSLVLLDPQVRVAGVVRPRMPEGSPPAAGVLPSFDVEALARDLSTLARAAP